VTLGEAIRLRRTELTMSQAELAAAAGVDALEIQRYEAGEQQPLLTVAAAIAAALRVPLAELAGLPADPAAGPGRVLQHVRHGIEFSARGDSNGELRVTGDDDAAVLLWAAAWLDEHRDWSIADITFQYPAWPGHEGTTATVVIELVPGNAPAGGHAAAAGALGPRGASDACVEVSGRQVRPRAAVRKHARELILATKHDGHRDRSPITIRRYWQECTLRLSADHSFRRRFTRDRRIMSPSVQRSPA